MESSVKIVAAVVAGCIGLTFVYFRRFRNPGKIITADDDSNQIEVNATSILTDKIEDYSKEDNVTLDFLDPLGHVGSCGTSVIEDKTLEDDCAEVRTSPQAHDLSAHQEKDVSVIGESLHCSLDRQNQEPTEIDSDNDSVRFTCDKDRQELNADTRDTGLMPSLLLDQVSELWKERNYPNEVIDSDVAKSFLTSSIHDERNYCNDRFEKGDISKVSNIDDSSMIPSSAHDVRMTTELDIQETVFLTDNVEYESVAPDNNKLKQTNLKDSVANDNSRQEITRSNKNINEISYANNEQKPSTSEIVNTGGAKSISKSMKSNSQDILKEVISKQSGEQSSFGVILEDHSVSELFNIVDVVAKSVNSAIFDNVVDIVDSSAIVNDITTSDSLLSSENSLMDFKFVKTVSDSTAPACRSNMEQEESDVFYECPESDGGFDYKSDVVGSNIEQQVVGLSQTDDMMYLKRKCSLDEPDKNLVTSNSVTLPHSHHYDSAEPRLLESGNDSIHTILGKIKLKQELKHKAPKLSANNNDLNGSLSNNLKSNNSESSDFQKRDLALHSLQLPTFLSTRKHASQTRLSDSCDSLLRNQPKTDLLSRHSEPRDLKPSSALAPDFLPRYSKVSHDRLSMHSLSRDSLASPNAYPTENSLQFQFSPVIGRRQNIAQNVIGQRHSSLSRDSLHQDQQPFTRTYSRDSLSRTESPLVDDKQGGTTSWNPGETFDEPLHTKHLSIDSLSFDSLSRDSLSRHLSRDSLSHDSLSRDSSVPNSPLFDNLTSNSPLYKNYDPILFSSMTASTNIVNEITPPRSQLSLLQNSAKDSILGLQSNYAPFASNLQPHNSPPCANSLEHCDLSSSPIKDSTKSFTLSLDSQFHAIPKYNAVILDTRTGTGENLSQSYIPRPTLNVPLTEDFVNPHVSSTTNNSPARTQDSITLTQHTATKNVVPETQPRSYLLQYDFTEDARYAQVTPSANSSSFLSNASCHSELASTRTNSTSDYFATINSVANTATDVSSTAPMLQTSPFTRHTYSTLSLGRKPKNFAAKLNDEASPAELQANLSASYTGRRSLRSRQKRERVRTFPDDSLSASSIGQDLNKSSLLNVGYGEQFHRERASDFRLETSSPKISSQSADNISPFAPEAIRLASDRKSLNVSTTDSFQWPSVSTSKSSVFPKPCNSILSRSTVQSDLEKHKKASHSDTSSATQPINSNEFHWTSFNENIGITRDDEFVPWWKEVNDEEPSSYEAQDVGSSAFFICNKFSPESAKTFESAPLHPWSNMSVYRNDQSITTADQSKQERTLNEAQFSDNFIEAGTVSKAPHFVSQSKHSVAAHKPDLLVPPETQAVFSTDAAPAIVFQAKEDRPDLLFEALSHSEAKVPDYVLERKPLIADEDEEVEDDKPSCIALNLNQQEGSVSDFTKPSEKSSLNVFSTDDVSLALARPSTFPAKSKEKQTFSQKDLSEARDALKSLAAFHCTTASSQYQIDYSVIVSVVIANLDRGLDNESALSSLQVIARLASNPEAVPHILAAKAPASFFDLLDPFVVSEEVISTWHKILSDILWLSREHSLTYSCLPQTTCTHIGSSLYTALYGWTQSGLLKSKLQDLSAHRNMTISKLATDVYSCLASS